MSARLENSKPARIDQRSARIICCATALGRPQRNEPQSTPTRTSRRRRVVVFLTFLFLPRRALRHEQQRARVVVEMAAGAKIDQVLRDLYKSLLKQCEDFERAHEDARSSLGSVDAKEKLAKCKSVLGEKRGKSQGVGEAVTVEAKYNELTSELMLADDLEPAQIKQWREMTKAKKKDIAEYRDQLNKLEMDMMKEDPAMIRMCAHPVMMAVRVLQPPSSEATALSLPLSLSPSLARCSLAAAALTQHSTAALTAGDARVLRAARHGLRPQPNRQHHEAGRAGAGADARRGLALGLPVQRQHVRGEDPFRHPVQHLL